MKKLVIILSSVLCSTAVLAQNTQSDNDVAPNAESGAIQIVNRPEILGQWGMEIPENKQCVEYYNFSGGNQLLIKSGQEWSVGQYQYQLPNSLNEQLPALMMHIQYDNNEQDCSGSREDQSGDIQQFFVKWINPQKIEFCGTEKGEKCFAVLNKTLP